MKVTDVRVRKVDTGNKLKAYATVTFDNEFVVRDIKIIESENGLFMAMPSKKTQSGNYIDIAHPTNQETRNKIEEAVFEAYESPEAEESFKVEEESAE